MSDYRFLASSKQLMPPCSTGVLEAAERDLGYRFPDEYRKFSLVADGGLLTESIILFSVGEGIHPAETLKAANEGRHGLPLVFIGRFAEEEFGFGRADNGEPCRPVYVYEHETDKTRKIADSFESLLKRGIARDVF